MNFMWLVTHPGLVYTPNLKPCNFTQLASFNSTGHARMWFRKVRHFCCPTDSVCLALLPCNTIISWAKFKKKLNSGRVLQQTTQIVEYNTGNTKKRKSWCYHKSYDATFLLVGGGMGGGTIYLHPKHSGRHLKRAEKSMIRYSEKKWHVHTSSEKKNFLVHKKVKKCSPPVGLKFEKNRRCHFFCLRI